TATKHAGDAEQASAEKRESAGLRRRCESAADARNNSAAGTKRATGRIRRARKNANGQVEIVEAARRQRCRRGGRRERWRGRCARTTGSRGRAWRGGRPRTGWLSRGFLRVHNGRGGARFVAA